MKTHTEEILDEYIESEQDLLQDLLDGKLFVEADSKILIKTHIESRLKLLKELKTDIIG